MRKGEKFFIVAIIVLILELIYVKYFKPQLPDKVKDKSSTVKVEEVEKSNKIVDYVGLKVYESLLYCTQDEKGRKEVRAMWHNPYLFNVPQTETYKFAGIMYIKPNDPTEDLYEWIFQETNPVKCYRGAGIQKEDIVQWNNYLKEKLNKSKDKDIATISQMDDNFVLVLSPGFKFKWPGELKNVKYPFNKKDAIYVVCKVDANVAFDDYGKCIALKLQCDDKTNIIIKKRDKYVVDFEDTKEILLALPKVSVQMDCDIKDTQYFNNINFKNLKFFESHNNSSLVELKMISKMIINNQGIVDEGDEAEDDKASYGNTNNLEKMPKDAIIFDEDFDVSIISNSFQVLEAKFVTAN